MANRFSDFVVTLRNLLRRVHTMDEATAVENHLYLWINKPSYD